MHSLVIRASSPQKEVGALEQQGGRTHATKDSGHHPEWLGGEGPLSLRLLIFEYCNVWGVPIRSNECGSHTHKLHCST